MYVFATLWLNVGQIEPEICDCAIKGHSLYSRYTVQGCIHVVVLTDAVF